MGKFTGLKSLDTLKPYYALALNLLYSILNLRLDP